MYYNLDLSPDNMRLIAKMKIISVFMIRISLHRNTNFVGQSSLNAISAFVNERRYSFNDN